MTAATADSSLPASLVTALYLRTKTLHVEAERTGIIRDLLHGGASREGYILLLRNLLPAYLAMEHKLSAIAAHLNSARSRLTGLIAPPRSKPTSFLSAASTGAGRFRCLLRGIFMQAGSRRQQKTTARG